MLIRSLQLNTQCNLNCVFCRASTNGVELLNERRLYREINLLKTHKISRLVLRGGEPTLSPYLIKIVKIGKALGVQSIDLHTNGIRFINNDFLSELISAGLGNVRFFFLSHEETKFDDLSCTRGLFPSLIDGINNASKALLTMEFGIPVSLSNLADLVQTEDFILSAWPETKDIFLVPVSLLSPEFRTREQIFRLKKTLQELSIRSSRANVKLHFDFWSQLSPEIKNCANPDIRKYFMHEAGCYGCSILGGCHGARLEGSDFLPVKYISDIKYATTFWFSRTGDKELDLVEEVMHSELEKNNIFTFYRPDRCPFDYLHQVIARINFNCNQRCRFCYNKSRPRVNQRDMEYMIRRILKVFKIIEIFSFSGGEPTLNTNLEKYINMLNEKHVKIIEIQTNAIQFADSDFTKRMALSGLNQAFVSFNAYESMLSDFITRAPGTFDKSLKGITNLIENNITVNLNHVINSLNFSKLPEFVSFVQRNFPGVFINFSMAQPFNWFPDRMMKYIPKFNDIAPYIIESLDRCLENEVHFGGLSERCGIPLCILNGEKRYYGDYHIIPTRHEKGYTENFEFIKVEACRRCDMADHCFGVRSRYARHYGTKELHPIKI